jgi:hypothetical protein
MPLIKFAGEKKKAGRTIATRDKTLRVYRAPVRSEQLFWLTTTCFQDHTRRPGAAEQFRFFPRLGGIPDRPIPGASHRLPASNG